MVYSFPIKKRGLEIRSFDYHNHKELREQLKDQRTHTWDIDRDIDWQLGIDASKYFLPLDADAVAFPGASSEQRLVLSQLMGLIVNATVAEMELVAHKIRDTTWRKVLDRYPVNPEMYELGEQFFQEEHKHAMLFRRFNDLFCESIGIEPADLASILPSAYGAMFQKAMIINANAGGHAFWWVVAVVEEVALLIYQSVYKHRKQLDPLFYHVHRRHFEEESRHTNYAFMMLTLIADQKPTNLSSVIWRRLDLVYSELFSSVWVLSELSKFRSVARLKNKHEFFAILASCLPLIEKMSTAELIQRMFVSAPYVSLILNRNYHKYSLRSAKAQGALFMNHPVPKPDELFLDQMSADLKEKADQAWLLNSV